MKKLILICFAALLFSASSYAYNIFKSSEFGKYCGTTYYPISTYSGYFDIHTFLVASTPHPDNEVRAYASSALYNAVGYISGSSVYHSVKITDPYGVGYDDVRGSWNVTKIRLSVWTDIFRPENSGDVTYASISISW